MPAGVAFYDFDNTLISGDIGPLFGDYIIGERFEKIKDEQGLAAAKRDRARLWARYTPYLTWLGLQVALYKLRAVRRSRLVRLAYKSLKGIEAEDYYGMMPDFVEQEIPDRIYEELRESIQKHQAAGREVVIITTGIDRLVQHCLRFFPGKIHVIGCSLKQKNGRFTGKVEGPLYGADKANIISAYVAAKGAKLEDCYAYSDHYSDFQMLEVVGHAVCVNPRSRLTRLAQSSGWKIVRPKSPGES